jgi:hypothetical protein
MNLLRICFGILLVALGGIIIKFGDKYLTGERIQGGIILKIFSHSYLNPKLIKWQRVLQKWVVGLVTIWFGFWLMFDFK